MIDNNTTASNNLANNNIANGNKVSLFGDVKLDIHFEELLLYFGKTTRTAIQQTKLLENKSRQLETMLKILDTAKNISEKHNIEIKPAPLKINIPLLEKASLEHEEDMYNLWAKLLVATSNEYDPIHIQYTNLLSQIGYREAQLLKSIYKEQKNRDGAVAIYKCKRRIEEKKDAEAYERYHDAITNKSSFRNALIGIYAKGVKFPLEIQGELETFERRGIDIDMKKTFPKSKELVNTIDILERLNLIYVERQFIKNTPRSWFPYWSLVLTEFGYNFVDTLEKYNTENK